MDHWQERALERTQDEEAEASELLGWSIEQYDEGVERSDSSYATANVHLLRAIYWVLRGILHELRRRR